MWAVISLPLESRTRATFRSAELGFFGVIVLTWRQTPRLNGQASSTGDLVLYTWGRRGFWASWLVVGVSRWFRSPRPVSRDRPGVNPSGVALGAACVAVTLAVPDGGPTDRARSRGR